MKKLYLLLALLLCGCQWCNPGRLAEKEAQLAELRGQLRDVQEGIKNLPVLQAQVEQLRRRRDRLRQRGRPQRTRR